MSKTRTPAHISRDDLERKLRAFQGDIKGAVDNQRNNPVSYTHLTLPTNREV